MEQVMQNQKYVKALFSITRSTGTSPRNIWVLSQLRTLDTWASLSDMALLPRLSTLQFSLVTSNKSKKPFKKFPCISSPYMQWACTELRVAKIDEKTNTPTIEKTQVLQTSKNQDFPNEC